MNILVIGQGGRESALVWALSKDKSVEKIYCAPGNPGTAQIAYNLPIDAENLGAITMASWEKHVDLVVVGPEGPLAQGLADMLRNIGIPVFGPSRQAAQIEASKIFCKTLLARYKIPTASFTVFDDASKAHAYVERCPLPVAIKVDGLAQGKGVVVAKTLKEAHEAIERFMVQRIFGNAGEKIIIEKFLRGRECSFMVVSDGEYCIPFLPARDYKQAFDGNEGPNTGGMGAYSPVPDFTSEMQDWCMSSIMLPTIRAMAKEDAPFTGVLYAGLMLTKQGPMVLEFNARFGDPETQAVLPLLESDFAELVRASLEGALEKYKMKWSSKKSVCISLVSEGYPGEYKKGKKITGIERAVENPNVVVFHAGTLMQNTNLVTDGGRVLNVVALGRDHEEARVAAYIASSKISFDGMRYRKDIAANIE